MPRLALKPDSSFFRKITLGAVGSRRVAEDLDQLGHRIAELERGAMDTKLWKEVKRKRVRITRWRGALSLVRAAVACPRGGYLTARPVWACGSRRCARCARRPGWLRRHPACGGDP